jgi:hypothetical protein
MTRQALASDAPYAILYRMGPLELIVVVTLLSLLYLYLRYSKQN